MSRVSDATSSEQTLTGQSARSAAARETRVRARRAAILRAAAAIMVRTGYHQMSMQAVADAAGMSVGLIYQYFGNKHDVLRAVIVDILEEFRDEVPAAMSAAGDDPYAQLAQGFSSFCQVIDAHRDAVLLAYRESQTLDAAGREEIMRLERETIDPFRAAVQAGIESGVFLAVPADLVAHNLKLAAHGWALKHWDLSPARSLDDYVREQLDLLRAALGAA